MKVVNCRISSRAAVPFLLLDHRASHKNPSPGIGLGVGVPKHKVLIAMVYFILIRLNMICIVNKDLYYQPFFATFVSLSYFSTGFVTISFPPSPCNVFVL